MKTRDNRPVETVFIPEERRDTICFSSQSGCPLHCTFCLTAQLGLLRNLTAGEIVEQIVVALNDAYGENVKTPRGTRLILGFEWPERVTEAERRSLVAGGLGWMLDAMDVMLYSMVLASLVVALGMSKQEAGFLNSLTLFASAIGGLMFGWIADRIGRTRALMASILVYSLSSFACGLSQSIEQLAVFRFVLGLGMGGEWTTGAALIAEVWPAEHRGKALGLMQSAWAIGEMIAACVTLLVLPNFGWRAVFFVGVLPALVVLSDSPARFDRFLSTRPLASHQLCLAKALFVLLLLILPAVLAEVLPSELVDSSTQILVNPSGSFVSGGMTCKNWGLEMIGSPRTGMPLTLGMTIWQV